MKCDASMAWNLMETSTFVDSVNDTCLKYPVQKYRNLFYIFNK